MPTFRPTADLDMHYEVDNYTDPWRSAQAILLLHGNAESGRAWYGWVPSLARRYRLVRPDMRGFGDSTPMPRDYAWSLDRLIDDFVGLMDHLDIDRFHLVGAKIGGTIARAFAARQSRRILSLTVVGTPPPLRTGAAERVPELNAAFERDGVEAWARATMRGRLGGGFPPEGIEWWIRFMGRTAVSTQIGFMATIACADIRADLSKIRCPTLVVTTDGSGLASVAETRQWQEEIANSELVVLPGDSYHAAASHAAQCVAATLAFLARNGG